MKWTMVKTRIYYQDTDAGGVVYYANYLKFFEKSWFEYLLSLCISLPEWEKSGTFIMVKTVRLELMEKLMYADEIELHTAVVSIKNAQFILHHRIVKNGTVTAEGETQMVCVDGSGKLKRLPEKFKGRLTASLS